MSQGTVLLIDDDEAIRKSLHDALLPEGFRVLTESDGDVGLTVALGEKPDIIVVDVEMPKVNGMDMLKKLRQSNDYGAKVPVIILTSFDTNDKVIQGIVEDEPAMFLRKSDVNPTGIVHFIKEKLAQISTNAQ